MKIKEFIEITATEDKIRVRGQLVLKDSSEIEEHDVVGVAQEDIKKGQIGVIKL